MNPPKWVFLDFDNTLWDFDANAEEALGELFHKHHLHLKSGFSVRHFIDLYQEVNKEYWERYEKGEIEKEYLRTARFTDTFLRMGIPEDAHPENIWHEYLEICPVMTRLVPGAKQLLEMCKSNAFVGIITNGFQRTQEQKIQHSDLTPYIDLLVTSENAGCAKPSLEIFQTALTRAGVERHECIYMGDTFPTDVLGALGAEIPVIWFNPGGTDPGVNILNNDLYIGQFQSLIQVSSFFSEQWGWE